MYSDGDFDDSASGGDEKLCGIVELQKWLGKWETFLV
jgi:hypothetical protein